MVTPGIAAQRMAARGEVRIGVVGGHGGAGATTLAIALAYAAINAGKATLLVDADPLGGGIKDRIGRGVVLADGALTVIGAHDVTRAAPLGTAVRKVDHKAEATVVDLCRTLDAGQLAAARTCDLVYVVADAQRNEAATRRVLDELTKHDVPCALVARVECDQTADYVASDFTVPRPGEMRVDDKTVQRDGRVDLRPEWSELLRFATELLEDLPIYVAEVAAV